MANRIYNVLFLCTGNSARSILGERLVSHWGEGHFQGFSAGSQPKGVIHPLTIEVLSNHHIPVEGLRSKDWNEFVQPGAPQMDFIFTVCDAAAAEQCPLWPGHPMTAHWGITDPAAVEGDETTRKRAFLNAFIELEARIKIFVSLPFSRLDTMKLRKTLDEIGQTTVDEVSSDCRTV